jgi:Sulfotransferase domain
MISKIAAVARFVLGADFPGRNLRTYPDDTFLTSYAKSGNTWTRFLVASLLHPDESITLVNADKLIPSTTQTRRYLNAVPRPRILKSHFPFDPSYRRVVYIVRDPRDVAVSQYHFKIKRGVLTEGSSMDEFVGSFVRGEATPYGSWREHVGSWLAARLGDPDFLLLRYEDLHRQTEVEVGRLARFFGVEPTPQKIQRAIEQSSADRMRKLEQTEAGKWDSTRDTRKGGSFFRSAKTGDGKASLSQQSLAQIEDSCGPLMRWLGYETSGVSRGGASYADFWNRC